MNNACQYRACPFIAILWRAILWREYRTCHNIARLRRVAGWLVLFCKCLLFAKTLLGKKTLWWMVITNKK
ncbi:MAG: hypothetical protein KJ666_10320 [Bacteroidetes bacterium]|nr:hypothetical protein [Bacteroidota bacterium]